MYCIDIACPSRLSMCGGWQLTSVMNGCEFLSVLIPQEQLNNWDFDIFKAESLSNKQPLRYVGQELFSRHDLFRRCNVSNN